MVARALLEEKLVACVSLLPKADSYFMWDGELKEHGEVVALLKTTRAAYPQLESRLNELHPYDVPEIIALPVERGLEKYVGWVRETCAPASPLH